MFRTETAPLTLHRLLDFCCAEARAAGLLSLYFLTESDSADTAVLADATFVEPPPAASGGAVRSGAPGGRDEAQYAEIARIDDWLYSLDQGFIDRLWSLLATRGGTMRPASLRQIIRDIGTTEVALSMIAWFWRNSLHAPLAKMGETGSLMVVIDTEARRISLHRLRPQHRPHDQFRPAMPPLAECHLTARPAGWRNQPDPRYRLRPQVPLVPSQSATAGRDLVWVH